MVKRFNQEKVEDLKLSSCSFVDGLTDRHCQLYLDRQNLAGVLTGLQEWQWQQKQHQPKRGPVQPPPPTTSSLLLAVIPEAAQDPPKLVHP
ncbi:hypothetical protein PGT21_005549 [Puccinia graminis f. sp. tritici]|uniref:Uncharacterized protein n=1 Tax=Puccinia graminis f. sp. tritici TaxID=56615 RepID=A0A5B0N685_PUCGR|nr:hypothetical protein PGT21_020103 [Puccinia graminis f. sp. tritici]KAA1092511.1 hypothetical protein PGT21_005549 [Puccinia graminis f. sp. tritici]KAA1093612.1 hypothetical protein PGTUg99_008116 [Puccinia graminis f. sp. tritici]